MQYFGGKMQRKAINRVILFVVMAVLLSSGSCSLLREFGLVPPVFKEDFSQLNPEEFPEKIRQLEEISKGHKNEYVRIRALFYIALAHMHYNNPSPDYSKALKYLDEYIVLDTKNKNIDEVMAWKSTLFALDSSLREYEILEQSYAQLKQDYESANKNKESLNKKVSDLEKLIEKQKKEIKNLEETINKLDIVQREIEKKKRKIKK
jgi:outer membrane protein assembly factor BamD (BamD/ComL family)